MNDLTEHARHRRHSAEPPSRRVRRDGDNSCEVVQFQRRPGRGAFSVERMFDDIRSALPADIRVTVHVNRFLSRGALGRIHDMLRARWLSGDINHILGDVHYLTLLLPRRRTILTILDCVSMQRLSPIKRWLFSLLWYRLPLRHAVCVTVISEFTRKAVVDLSGYPAERVHVIPPPLSSEFTQSPLPVRTGSTRILQVGTPANKNLPRVIEALAGLPVIFVIVGVLGDAETSRLKELGIVYENHVDLDRTQLVDQYRRADAVVFASVYEGFGLPIIEAQAVGRPVVTSNIEPMPEVAGGAACFIDPFDVADIRRGVRAVTEDASYARDLINRGLENVARYSPGRVAERYATIYRGVHDSLRRSA